MEIKFQDISLKYKNKYLTKNLNVEIKKNMITGIYNDIYNLIPNLLCKNLEYSGIIYIDNKEIKDYMKDKISYISLDCDFLTKTVSDEFYLKQKDLKDETNDYIDKIISSLNMVGLNKNYLDRDIYSLSRSEKKLLQIALFLVVNPDVIIFDNVFSFLDKRNQIRLKNIIVELKKKYEKNIIIIDQDINILYEICNDIIIFKEGDILIHDDIKKVFQNLDFLKECNIELPNILKFIKIAKEKGINLPNQVELKDLIKDVYRYANEIKKDV